MDVGIREKLKMISLTPSKVFWPKKVGGWICHLLRLLRLHREKDKEFSLNKLSMRCLLELGPGLAIPRINIIGETEHFAYIEEPFIFSCLYLVYILSVSFAHFFCRVGN